LRGEGEIEAIITVLARFAACPKYWLKLLISTMNLKFMFLACCETGAQNRLFNNAKLSTVMLSAKTKKDASQYQIFFLHLKCEFLNIIIK
jgi:hypothetical protein